MNEFDPSSQAPKDIKKFAGWLISAKARLDANDTDGYAVTKLVVKDPNNNGQWGIPLRGAIDMVNDDDLRFATEDPAHIKLIEATDQTSAQIEVLYTGIDDELRRATVDVNSPIEFSQS